MFLKLPNGNLLNLDHVTDILFNEQKKTATLMGYGINLVADSPEAFKYFTGEGFLKDAKIVKL